MKALYQDIKNRLDGKYMLNKSIELWKIEYGQTFSHYHQSIDWICEEMKAANIPNVEKVCVPADGITVYEDKRMPIAWDATIGKLTLLDGENTVAADFSLHPFNLVKGSTSTKKGGEVLRIITEQQLLAGEDPVDALVMLETTTPPRAAVIKPILDLGCRGFICDFLKGRYEHPDAIQWVNAGTEGIPWHVQAEDRDFIGFSVSLRMGDKIRQLANKGTLAAVVECDGHRYAGELPAATALIKGKKEEEIWLLAHAFEPLLDDDSVGVIAGIEIAKQIMAMGTPEYSLRLIFAMELYGYAAYHANFNGKVIGACNLDFLCVNSTASCLLTPSIATVPFHGNDIIRKMVDEFQGVLPCSLGIPICGEDLFLSDSTTGVPTVWVGQQKDPKQPLLWHNSAQNTPSYVDAKTFAEHTALATVWFAKTLFYTGNAAVLPNLTLKEISSPYRDYASNQVYARTVVGMPYDLVRIPKNKRKFLPGNVMYGPLGHMLARMDGKKNLAQIILEVEAEQKIILSDKEIKKYLDSINYLADWGYVSAIKRTELTSSMLAKALKQAGVKENDTLLVHSSLSNCGYFANGPVGIINGVMESVGENGTALFPTFTRPYIALGNSVNKNWLYRPYDENDPSQVWTGAVPAGLLEEFPNAMRSRHVTHSWAGLGPKVKACISSHGPCDPPASESSPLAKALKLDGKVVFIGTGLGPSTFIHYLETINDMPFLQPAVCKVKNPDGSARTVFIDKHLPGHRDFYGENGDTCKFYNAARKAGLKIETVSFGMDKIQVIKLKDLYEIGMKLLKEDPRILLCDNPECTFCRNY